MRSNVPKGISRVRRASRVRPIERRKLKKKKLMQPRKLQPIIHMKVNSKSRSKTIIYHLNGCLTFYQLAD